MVLEKQPKVVWSKPHRHSLPVCVLEQDANNLSAHWWRVSEENKTHCLLWIIVSSIKKKKRTILNLYYHKYILPQWVCLMCGALPLRQQVRWLGLTTPTLTARCWAPAVGRSCPKWSCSPRCASSATPSSPDTRPPGESSCDTSTRTSPSRHTTSPCSMMMS